MADTTDRRVALFSIHPRFADAILSGEKRVEFRRRGPSPETSHVIVYATAPVQRVVGWFKIDGVEAEAPEALWARFGGVGGIGPEEFDRYYGARDRGTAIRVADAERLAQPMALEVVDGSSTPPQSFRYVSWEAFELLRRRVSGQDRATSSATA